jgi:hypothetical protein
LIITILQNFLLDYTSLQELKLNPNSNLNYKLKKTKNKKTITIVDRLPEGNQAHCQKLAQPTRARGTGRLWLKWKWWKEYKGGRHAVVLGLTLFTHHFAFTTAPSFTPSAPLPSPV